MSSIDSWQAMMIKNLRSQGRKSRAAISDQYNMAMGSSGAMSGAGRSATEGIAAQEAVDASGINALAADAQAERDDYRKETEQARKDANKAAWISGISNVAGAFAPGLIGGALNIGKKIFGKKAPAVPTAAPLQLPPVVQPRAAGSMQGSMTGQLQPGSNLTDFFLKSRGVLKKFPEYRNLYDQFDISRRYK